jgi:transposase
MGMSHKEIRRLCQISKTTLAAYLKQFRNGGLEGLKQLNYKGRPNKLHDHRTSLEAYFKEHLPRTTAEAQAIIEEITGIKALSHSGEGLHEAHRDEMTQTGSDPGQGRRS